jgi:purine-binding chemotaxis protein CheW
MAGKASYQLPVLTFSLGAQTFALLIEDVIEAAAMVELVDLPDARPEILGLANRRGRMLPMLDLRRVFKQPAQPVTSATLFIVAAGGGREVGLVVDEIQQVEYADSLNLQDAPASSKYIHGIISYKGELIPIISLPNLLNAFLSEEAAEEQEVQ